MVRLTLSDKELTPIPVYVSILGNLFERPSVDYFAFADGEVSMSEIVKKYGKNE